MWKPTPGLSIRSAAAVAFVPLLATPVAATMLRVAPSGGDYTTVAAAMAAAQDGDSVAVVAGLHLVQGVQVKEGVQLLGGWNASFTGRTPGTSHLRSTGGGTILQLSLGQTTKTLIDGFEMSGSNNSAILCHSSSATIRDNDIHDNYAQDGGAVHCEYGASPTIEYNHIHHNRAVYGGGVRGHYGANNSPLVRENLFEYNHAYSAGGGLAMAIGSPRVEDNIVRFNSAEGTGGGIHVHHAGGGVVEVRRNLIIYNVCRDGAGLGINGGHPIVEYNTLWGNSAWRYGGAISQAESEDPAPGTTYVRNNIIGGSIDGHGVYCINEFSIALSCNDVYGNADGDYFAVPAPVGDIAVDPLFCDYNAFLLASNSPCAPGSSCGSIGAYGVGCGTISVAATSWGRLKAAFR